jgi:hypothetical protein
VKSRINPVVAFIIIAIGVCVSLPLIKLLVGTALSNNIGHQYTDADVLARAFSDYAKTHEGRYPTYRNSDEAFDHLMPLLVKEASKVSESGYQYTTMNRLEETAKKAVWNQSLSGGKAIAIDGDSPPWVFYMPAIHSGNRFVIGYADGKHKNLDKSQMTDIFLSPLSKP